MKATEEIVENILLCTGIVTWAYFGWLALDSLLDMARNYG